MENILFFKIEIVTFFVSFLYSAYYLGEKAFHSYKKVKKVVIPENINTKKSSMNRIKMGKRENNYKKTAIKHKKLTDSEINKISEILKKIKVHSTKGYFDTAKNLIIEGLAIDKFNKDLNMELAMIYEREKNYKNAEYIYRDLREVLKDDFEVAKKLGFILAMQRDFKGAISIYENIHKNHPADNEVVEMLADLTYNVEQDKSALKYLNLFLKEKPRSVEKMFMKCDCLEATNNTQEAFNIYTKILELQPYNTKARDKIKEISGN